MKVAVTGATGFIGRHLVEQLGRRGHQVVAVCRTPSRAADLGVEVRQADLADPDAMAAAFEGVDAVVANAALVPGHGDAPEHVFRATNVQGASNHLHGVRAHGIRRLLWVSTVAVYRTRLFVLQDESSPRIDPDRPRFDWNNVTTHPMYSRSKAEAERMVWDFAREHAVDLTVFRPGPVYGPGDGKLTQRYADQLKRRFTTAPTAQVSHVHGADVASAVALAVDVPTSHGKAYNLAGEAISPFQLLRQWRTALGARTRILPVPVPIRVRFDDTAAQRDLGWRPMRFADAIPGLNEAFFG